MSKISYLTASVLFFSLGFSENIFAEDPVPAGVIITSEGSVKAVGSTQAEREIKRGSSFYSSETIVVGPESKVQLKFSDGGLVDLIAMSEFRISSYSFNALNQSNESVTSLAKGGFRMLSGSIAKESPDRVKIETPVATIGLLGTTLECNLSEGTAYFSCTEGRISLTNNFGTLLVGEGSSSFARVEAYKAPEPLSERPAGLSDKAFTPLKRGQPVSKSRVLEVQKPSFSENLHKGK